MGEKNAMLLKETLKRDESTEEKLPCKQQYLYIPRGTRSPGSLLPWPCLCTESMLQIYA